jgi:hypothetical protein
MWFFFNDVPMEEMFEDYPNLEIKSNKIPKNEEEWMEMNFQKLES